MGQMLERFGEVSIVDETNGFGLDFVKKTETLTPVHQCWGKLFCNFHLITKWHC